MVYSPFRHIGSVFWKRRPIQLTFFLTRKCNARCAFCFYLSRERASEDGTDLSLQEIEKVSAGLGRLLWVAFSGGEIFLRDDLVEIVQVFARQNRPSIILLPTNGLLPSRIREGTEAILRRCPNSTVVVKLSLDGPEDVHDPLRGVVGAFRKTLETYEQLSPLLDAYPNFELGINSVLCAANQDRMEELVRFCQDLDPSLTHTVSLIRGEVRDQGMKDVDAGVYLRIARLLESNLLKAAGGRYRFIGSRIKAAQDLLQRRIIHDTVLRQQQVEHRQPRRGHSLRLGHGGSGTRDIPPRVARDSGTIPCYAGRLNLVLTENGEVFPCEAFAASMGNVRDAGYDMKRLVRTPAGRDAIRSISAGGCFCTHECYTMTNILFNLRMYPALLDAWLKLRSLEPLQRGPEPPLVA